MTLNNGPAPTLGNKVRESTTPQVCICNDRKEHGEVTWFGHGVWLGKVDKHSDLSFP